MGSELLWSLARAPHPAGPHLNPILSLPPGTQCDLLQNQILGPALPLLDLTCWHRTLSVRGRAPVLMCSLGALEGSLGCDMGWTKPRSCVHASCWGWGEQVLRLVGFCGSHPTSCRRAPKQRRSVQHRSGGQREGLGEGQGWTTEQILSLLNAPSPRP